MVCCAISGCTSHSRDLKKLGLSFHRFPVSSETRQKWLALCKRGDGSSIRVCSRHFDQSDYNVDLRAEYLGIPSRRTLKKESVPHLFLSSVSGDRKVAKKLTPTKISAKIVKKSKSASKSELTPGSSRSVRLKTNIGSAEPKDNIRQCLNVCSASSVSGARRSLTRKLRTSPEEKMVKKSKLASQSVLAPGSSLSDRSKTQSGSAEVNDDIHQCLKEDSYSNDASKHNDTQMPFVQDGTVYVSVSKDEYTAVKLNTSCFGEVNDSMELITSEYKAPGTTTKQTNADKRCSRDAISSQSDSSNGCREFATVDLDLHHRVIKEELIEEDLSRSSNEHENVNSCSSSNSSTKARAPANTRGAAPPPAAHRTASKRNHSFLEDDDVDDDFTAFGRFVASELRQMRSEERRRRLKRLIQRAILDMGEEDDLEFSISIGPISDR